MFIGIDLGTSGIKVLLVDEAQRVVASHTESLRVSNPHPGWSEQDPADWWTALLAACDRLAAEHPAAMAAVRGIGLSGQQHGAVLLDAGDAVLRPCILWNDVRSVAECAAFEAAFPDSRQVTGNLAMPGFTAPKLLWVKAHEPEIFARTRTVLLPKAWVRLMLTGEKIEDMSDASGTLWLDVGARRWSRAALDATGLDERAMPRLVEGTAPAGQLLPELVQRWGMASAPVVAGSAGDNAAGAVGLGAVKPGQSFVSLGTSGVVWATTDRFRPNAGDAVHAFCHTVPDTWHQMGVTLSAAASLAWWSRIAGRSEGDLIAEVPERIEAPGTALFAPYLSGERTPHNDGAVRGAFVHLAQDTDRAALTQAVLEGVAFSLRDALEGLRAAGSTVTEADVIGGGSKSRVWVEIIAATLGITLHRLAQGETGGAFGAARLARIAATGEAVESVCTPPERLESITPDPSLRAAYDQAYARYRTVYPAIRSL
ncbi:glycerol kinase [Ameyamaea chiangmaiensis NBRC 103196]|uniref:Xylulose kinase n=1 Tax=Ameyamaea chiangmaiensis TaxID=442969 RepID=A0A850P9X9_9PROT|nr:xylulokinase [Ameyamaea chiangmaiensis]MBS4075951.1 xylulokinase [Ameyamaea chiangmaiensis]NVN39763.1 xylulokinase [Ameyamaea chiangmaiensis]GBQ61630.1 glycerol kinase [Ameyamaea chiangmaiensis NBRC 103196]